MEIRKTQQEFNHYLQLLKDHFTEAEEDGLNWSEITSILMLRINLNWTTESSNSNYQINSDNVKDFFPILQISDSFPHWRLSMPAFIPCSVLRNFAELEQIGGLLSGKISYRHKIQNGSPYLQLTFEGEFLRSLKNSLRQGNEIFFLKEQNSSNYQVLASRDRIFDKTSLLAINPDLAARDKTVYELDEIQMAQDEEDQQVTGENVPPVGNIIYYGSPGTGKSFRADSVTQGHYVQKVTFHPDYDYHSFVGGFKPSMIGEGRDAKIAYKFVPQIFTKIYVDAWKNFVSEDETKIHYLQIEEINRGNCAEIFGDLFQLLDRGQDGFSKYAISAEEEMRRFLEDIDCFQSAEHRGIKDGKLSLPANLRIIATMNTSDQSLFPMDSAFKRRWDWIYVPIDTNCTQSDFTIELNNGEKYKWLGFLKAVNKEIFEITESQDKQIGNWFVDAQNHGKIIGEEKFVNKVIFYLWNDVFKDVENNIFRSPEGNILTYSSFFEMENEGQLGYILKNKLGLTDANTETATDQ